MKTINVFLASSEELDYFRMTFGNLVRRLDDVYERRGVRVKLYEWEDYDAVYNNRRKLAQYNDIARKSDMFVAMFGTLAKKFTLEEFDAALDEYRKRKAPKIYVYCMDLRKQKKRASKKLMTFQARLSNEIGYYWCSYNNRESMQLQFVMQLQLLESGRMDDMKVENGNVVLGSLQVAKMDNLKFAAANEDYLEMGKELADLPSKIEEARLRLLEHPEDEDLVEDLQGKLDKYNDLKGRFEEHQQLLFQAAMRVAKLQGEVITERMRDAMNALDEGRVRDAIIILDLAEEDASRNLEDYRQSREMTEEKRQVVFCSIEELLLKASSVMADASITIEQRILKADYIYAQADEMALECDYDKEKYINLLFDYGIFLINYEHYEKALKLAFRLVKMNEDLFGTKHRKTGSSYNYIGDVYSKQGNYLKSLEYHLKSLEILEKSYASEKTKSLVLLNIGDNYYYLGDYDKAIKYYQDTISKQECALSSEHQLIAESYNHLCHLYIVLGDYNNALFYCQKAISIREKFGLGNRGAEESYYYMGVLYKVQGEYDKALVYLQKAITIYEKEYGNLNPNTITVYINLADVYYFKGDHATALKYYQETLSKCIRTKQDGEHPQTASLYNNIGAVYRELGKNDIALEYYQKSLVIRLKKLGPDHPDTADSYCNIGLIYYDQGEYEKALKYYGRAVLIFEKELGQMHPDLATLYNNIGAVYCEQGNYEKALEYRQKSLAIRLEKLGPEHPDTADSYNDIGLIYYYQGNYSKAFEYYQKSLNIRMDVQGPNHPITADTFNNIGLVCYFQGDYDKALEYHQKSLSIRMKVFGIDHPNTRKSITIIGNIYLKLGDTSKAQQFFDKIEK